jgi:hypothetical protein
MLDSDSAIHDPPRLMRLPGFINHKKPVAACQVIDEDRARIYNLKFLIPTLYAVVTESDYMAQYVAAVHSTKQSKKPLQGNISAVKIAGLTAAKWPGVTKGGRNRKAFQNAAYLLKNLGLTKEQAWPILRHWNYRNNPPLPEWELRQALRNAGIYGRHPAGSKVAG